MSLALMIGLYSLYAKFLVPLIEGPPNIVRHDFHPPHVELSSQQYDKTKLTPLFPEDAWENKECKVLATEQGLVMFQQFHRLEGGYLEVLPFTLVMKNSAQGLAEPVTKTPPTVLRCSRGARLKFDDPDADPLSGKSKLESARLVGGVDIYRPASDPAKDDAVEILTSNVQINKRQIYTIDEVQFAFGSHRGQGKQLSIEFAHEHRIAAREGFESISGIKRLELAYLRQLQLLQSPNTSSPGTPAKPVSNRSNTSSLPSISDPVNITCAGPFVLDLDRNTATFNEQVRVSMEGKNRNEINCRRLTVYFDSKAKRSSQVPTPPATSPANQGTDQWAVQRLVAEGSPAIFTSDLQQANVKGNILSYHLGQQEIVVQQLPNSATPVVIELPDFRFQAIQVAYKIRPDGGLGEMIAQGPGNLLRAATASEREFFLEWARLLAIKPESQQQVIEVSDGCHIRFDQTTHFKSRQMKLWLNEIETDTASGQGDRKTKFQYQPDRLLATGNVEVVSAQLNGKTEKLTATWVLSELPLEKQAQRLSLNQRRSAHRFSLAASGFAVTAQTVFFAQMPMAAGSVISFQDFPQDQILPGMQQIELAPAVQAIGGGLTGEIHPWPAEENQNGRFAGAAPRVVHDAWVQPTQFMLVEQQDPEPRSKRYAFVGNEVDVKLLYRDDVTVIQDLTATGNVGLSEVADPFAKDDRPPLTITGHQLRCVPQADECVRVLVSGLDEKRAVVRTEQFELAGNQIHLDQVANKLWIDGPGESAIALQPDVEEINNPDPPNSKTASSRPRDLQNSNYQSIGVKWQSGMVFNGRKVYFEDRVEFAAEGVNQEGHRVRTTASAQGVTLELNRQVDFRQMEPGEKNQLEVREIVLVDQVAGGQRVFNLAKANVNPGINQDRPTQAAIAHQSFSSAGALEEKQRFLASQITMDVRSGLLTSKGPGVVTHHRRGGPALMGAKTNSNAARNRMPSPLPANLPSGEINFVRINFDGTANANTSEKRLLIRGNVRTLYASVDSFEKLLDPDRSDSLPADAVKVKCDRLEFNQWTPRNATEPTHELLAVGNAHVTSQSFEAAANQIRYDQATDKLVIEGTPRSDAQLWYHPVANPNDRKHLVAQKVIYWPGDQSYEIQGIKNIDSKN
jgi:hypothetical protein